MTDAVSIELGELGESFSKRYPGLVRVQHQPAGLDFYEIDWPEHAGGKVRVKNGDASFDVQEVLSVLATHDLAEFRAEGLNEVTMNAGISGSNLISHEEARLRTYEILRRLLGTGWRQVIERSEPRLSGKARQDYMFATSSLNGLDATYIASFADWMRLENATPWSFFANGAYLEISFARERSLMDPKKPGAYLLRFNLKSEAEYFRGFAGPANRQRWKELLPEEFRKAADSRAHKEDELRTRGIPIDESYQDPPPQRQ